MGAGSFTYPTSLDLRFFSDGNDYAFYELFSVIEYQPTHGAVLGHFISYGLVNGGWLKFNDNRISQEADITRGARSPFMLFYRKRLGGVVVPPKITLKLKIGVDDADVIQGRDSVASIVLQDGLARRESDTPSLTSSYALSSKSIEQRMEIQQNKKRSVETIEYGAAAAAGPGYNYTGMELDGIAEPDEISEAEETILVIGRKRICDREICAIEEKRIRSDGHEKVVEMPVPAAEGGGRMDWRNMGLGGFKL
jgi:hypothetical protein